MTSKSSTRPFEQRADGNVLFRIMHDDGMYYAPQSKVILSEPFKFTIDGRDVESNANVMPFLYSHERVCVDGFDDLHSMLCSLRPEWRSCLVYGLVKPEFENHEFIRRLIYDREDSPATIDPEYKTTVIHFDIDQKEITDPDIGYDDPEKLAKWGFFQLAQRIPPLADVKVSWHASNSAGKKGNERILKMHYWMLADRMLEQHELSALKSMTTIDEAVFRPQQPHYTSRPWCQHSSLDPLNGKKTEGCFGNHERILWDEVDELINYSPRRWNMNKTETVEFDWSNAASETNARGRRFMDGAVADLIVPSDSHSKIMKYASMAGKEVRRGNLCEMDAELIRQHAIDTGSSNADGTFRDYYRKGLNTVDIGHENGGNSLDDEMDVIRSKIRRMKQMKLDKYKCSDMNTID